LPPLRRILSGPENIHLTPRGCPLSLSDSRRRGCCLKEHFLVIEDDSVSVTVSVWAHHRELAEENMLPAFRRADQAESRGATARPVILACLVSRGFADKGMCNGPPYVGEKTNREQYRILRNLNT
jgi:hypothetical protein